MDRKYRKNDKILQENSTRMRVRVERSVVFLSDFWVSKVKKCLKRMVV